LRPPWLCSRRPSSSSSDRPWWSGDGDGVGGAVQSRWWREYCRCGAWARCCTVASLLLFFDSFPGRPWWRGEMGAVGEERGLLPLLQARPSESSGFSCFSCPPVRPWRQGGVRGSCEARRSLLVALVWASGSLWSFSSLRCIPSGGLLSPPLSMARSVASPCSMPSVSRAISSSARGSSTVFD
jgi:hypothetical protein